VRIKCVRSGCRHPELELALALRQWAQLSGRDDLWRRCLEVAVGVGADSVAAQARTGAVEKHLTNTYRKLGVRRRAELAEALHLAAGPG
jgi:hypothetical protein